MKSVRFTRLVLVLPLVLAGMSEAHAGNRSPGRWRCDRLPGHSKTAGAVSAGTWLAASPQTL